MSYMRQNKKQTFESAQYRLEISFKLLSILDLRMFLRNILLQFFIVKCFSKFSSYKIDTNYFHLLYSVGYREHEE